jgi:hypothetical protein
LRTGEVFFGLVFILAAAANIVLVSVSGSSYSSFADASMLGFVRDTWHSVVATHVTTFIPLLAVFEIFTGLMLMGRGFLVVIGLIAAIAFHVALLCFGWGFWLYCLPVLVVLALMLRAELRNLAESGRSSPG